MRHPGGARVRGAAPSLTLPALGGLLLADQSSASTGHVIYRYLKVGFSTYRMVSGHARVLHVALSKLGQRSFAPGDPLPTIILGVKQMGGAPRRLVIN